MFEATLAVGVKFKPIENQVQTNQNLLKRRKVTQNFRKAAKFIIFIRAVYMSYLYTVTFGMNSNFWS